MTAPAKRLAPLVEAGDLSAPPGSRLWSQAVRLEIQALLHDTESNADRLNRNLEGMREHAGYRQLEDRAGQPYPTFEAFCVEPPPAGLGYDLEALEHIVVERRSARARAQTPLSLLDRGPSTLEERTNPTNVRINAHGNHPDYRIARLARDHPAILARLQAGELPSVNAAAIEAGFVKREVSVPLEVETAAKRLARHFKGARREALLRLLEAQP